MTIIELQSLGPSLWLWSFATPDNICSLVPPQSALCLLVRSEARTSEQFIIFCCPRPGPAVPPQPRRRLSMIRTFWQKEWIILWLNILLSVLESVGPEIGDCEDGASVAPWYLQAGLGTAGMRIKCNICNINIKPKPVIWKPLIHTFPTERGFLTCPFYAFYIYHAF